MFILLIVFPSLTFAYSSSFENSSQCVEPRAPYLQSCIFPTSPYLEECRAPYISNSISSQADQLSYESCIMLRNSKLRLYEGDQERYYQCQSSNSEDQIEYQEKQSKYAMCLLSEVKKNKKEINNINSVNSFTVSQIKKYPDAGLTGNETSTEEVTNKINNSNSYLAYKKQKILTANQIIENINILGNREGGSVQDMQEYIDNLSQYQTIPRLVTKEHPAYTVFELAKRIKYHYPEYKNMTDLQAVNDFIAKYPLFKNRVSFESSKNSSSVSKTSSVKEEAVTSSITSEPSIVQSPVKRNIFKRIGDFFRKLNGSTLSI